MLSDSPTRTLHRSQLVVPPLPVVLKSGSGQVRLDEGTCLVGSGSRSNLLLDDPTVSRAHAEFTLVPEGVHVRDLGSRNGTFYQGQRLTTAILSPGTRLLLGAAPLYIELDEAHLNHAASLGGSLFRGMTGASAVMLRLFTTISRLDGSLVPVLVQGETGVGKELVARAIHEGSRVGSGPFVPVNCALLSRELAASTLFGHARGAFAGAVSARQGAFVSAHEGTLFLDEVGELPLEAQGSLLRALESGEVLPLGQDTARSVRVRVLAATNRDLTERVRAGGFREDLYFRLAVVTLVVPPLRDRREDIPELARCFARQEGASDLDDEVVAELSQRDFPGNVRELRNAVLAYLALGQLGHSPATREPSEDARSPRLDVPYLAQRDALVEAFTREYLIKLLEYSNGNQVQAARIAGLDRSYLGRMVNKLGLSRAGRSRQ
jgi:transcriptional regulator with GAF, ATPase, and Fis domain